jgi:hypothetical protein
MPAADSIWKRLRDNQAANAPTFWRAGLELGRIATLRCPSCGLEESALFWTPAGASSRVTMFTCPVCQRTRGRYDLRRNRARSPRDIRRILVRTITVLLVVMVSGGAFVRHAPDTDDLKRTLQRSWRQASTTTGDMVAWVEDSLERAGRALRGR